MSAVKKYSITVRGRRHEWEFVVLLKEKYADAMLSDGIVIAEVVNTVPQWWVDLYLPIDLWWWMQNVWDKFWGKIDQIMEDK